MSYFEEREDRILNDDTVVKPWKIEQFIKLFEYLIENGVDEFIRFASEWENIDISDLNYLRMLEVHGWHAVAPTKEKWKELLERYPKIKKFLEDNDMLDRRMLCSKLYFRDLFEDLKRDPNLAKTFLQNMKNIQCLHADICWCPTGLNPLSHNSNDMFASLAHATYDVTDGDEELVVLKKYYCGLDLEYHLLDSRFTEKNGRRYRHDIYDFEYKDAGEKYSISQTAGHGWLLQVINNGRKIRKMMVLQGFRMTNVIDHECHNLPSLEEVENFDLTDEMKASKKSKRLTKLYLDSLKRKQSE